ncbi:MAG TPA: hypothetical protein VES02_13440 [Dermatophilaceae bacterium]|nr:hypothetical protein [Dermatophilaceae bacterium]
MMHLIAPSLRRPVPSALKPVAGRRQAVACTEGYDLARLEDWTPEDVEVPSNGTAVGDYALNDQNRKRSR